MNYQNYTRYHIETTPAPNITFHPNRFSVKIDKWKLAQLLLKEVFHYRMNRKAIMSSPCVYGVFSGPFGGFSPREDLCVGCLRCTTEYPEIAQIYKNPERLTLGDSYLTSDQYEAIVYEAKTGRIPVKGAGYRGKFGGAGWDGMWADMSEIVRPTRDGIHGRETISTAVDIGGTPSFFKNEILSHNCTIPIPILFDHPPKSVGCDILTQILVSAAAQLKTYYLGRECPFTVVQVKGQEDLLNLYREGARVFHLTANYHGCDTQGRFILDMIRDIHCLFVQARCRDEVTLIGSGGIVAAEHLPKAIICGLDAVALDTPLLAALQAKFIGECLDRDRSEFQLPSELTIEWGTQRIKNLVNSWRDQLLEILGAMGLREVRRLRGEIGRAMFQRTFEEEAFKGIDGYAPR